MADPRQKQIDQSIGADVPTYYANTTALAVSPYDISLVFGLRFGEQVSEQARVVMSLQHAVVMTMVLRRTLREYVAKTGVKPAIPDEVMRDLQLDEEEPLW